MIERDLDVKDLINSQLFFAPIWTDHSLFAEQSDPVVCPVNCDIEDLPFEDPNKIFHVTHHQSILEKILSKFTQFCCTEDDEQQKKDESFEMQYNYIYLDKVQGDNKVSISHILKDCQNLELFEMEPIQYIIDYKWETYTYVFFLNKFQLYLVFLIFYYIDIERGI